MTLVKAFSERMHPADIICLWLPGQHHSQGLRDSLPKPQLTWVSIQAHVCHLMHQVSYALACDTQTQGVEQD